MKANPGLIDLSIQFIAVSEGELPGSPVKVLADVVASLGKFCPSLGSTKAEDRRCRKRTRFDIVANAYIPLLTRGVSVSVCGFQYLA